MNSDGLRSCCIECEGKARRRSRAWSADKITALKELKLQEVDDTKGCNSCFKIKPLSDFYKHAACRKGVSSRCKSCIKSEQNAPEKKQRHREYCIEKVFGLTPDEHSAMYAQQGGRCAICNTPEEHFIRRLAVDHCHVTGKIRGLLCGNCNTGLGKFKDDPERLEAAAEYLRRAA